MKRCICALFLALVALLSCSRDPEVEARHDNTPDESSFQQGILNVKFSPEMAELLAGLDVAATRSGSGRLDGVLDEIGATGIRRLFPADPVFEPRQHAFGLDRWYVLEFGSSPVTKAAEQLSAIPGVEYSEAIRKCSPRENDSWKLPFDDPAVQWALMNDGTLKEGFVRGADINVVPVWNKFTAGSSDVIVAVVDGGADTSNPDLASVVLTGENQSFNFCTNTAELVPFDHGTHVAGIIGAVGNNGGLVRGVAGGNGNGGVKLLNCQIFQYDPQYSSASDWYNHTLGGSTASAIVWACNHGAVICNNSWGYSATSEAQAAAYQILQADKEAIDYFIKYAGCDNSGNQLPGSPMKGGLVVFAAGNESWQEYAPSTYEPVVSVGAITPGLELAPYSNYGSTVDICAPGGDRIDSEDREVGIISTLPMDSKYSRSSFGTVSGYISGTSMSAPHVSGAAALLVSYFGGDGFTADQLKERLLGGADAVAVSGFRKPAGPLLDVFGSFTYPTFLANKVESLSADATGRTLTVRCTLPEDADGCVFAVSEDASLLDALNPVSIPEGVETVTAWGAEGKEVHADVVLEEHHDYHVVAIARNHNHFAPASAPLAVRTGGNRPPVAGTIPDVLIDTVGVAQALDLRSAFSDPDGDRLSFVAESSDPERISVSVQDSILVITASCLCSATISVTATDAGGLTASTSFKAVCRDKTLAADIYPMPVTDFFYIAPGSLVSLKWTLYSPEGKYLSEGTETCSCFAPAKVQMSGYRPGIYLLVLDIQGELSKYQIVKI